MCLMPSYTASFNHEQQSYEASRIITPTRCEKMSVKKLIYLIKTLHNFGYNPYHFLPLYIRPGIKSAAGTELTFTVQSKDTSSHSTTNCEERVGEPKDATISNKKITITKVYEDRVSGEGLGL